MSVTYSAALPVREETVLFLSGLLHAERRRLGTRAVGDRGADASADQVTRPDPRRRQPLFHRQKPEAYEMPEAYEIGFSFEQEDARRSLRGTDQLRMGCAQMTLKTPKT